MWPLFLRNINGVILVHDLSLAGYTIFPVHKSGYHDLSWEYRGLYTVLRRSIQSVPSWAEYVAANATYSGPLADEYAAANLGGLAVPYLIVGNKADLQGKCILSASF